MAKVAGNKLLSKLLAAIVLLVLLHLAGQVLMHVVGESNRVTTDIANRFNLDAELSVPTWFASFLALVAAVLTYITARLSKGNERATWLLLSGLLLFVSIDEVAAIHELLLQGLHILAQFGEGRQTLLANAWLLVLPILVLGGLYVMRQVVRSLPKRTISGLVLAGIVYLLGAFVIEYISIELPKVAIWYGIAVICEETLEFLGLWLLIRATLLHVTLAEPRLSQALRRVDLG